MKKFCLWSTPWPGGNSAAGTLRRLDGEYEISLYTFGASEMISQVPQSTWKIRKSVPLLCCPVRGGKLIQTSFLAFFRHGRTENQYVIQFFRMKTETFSRTSSGVQFRMNGPISETFDLAVAYLEGGSAQPLRSWMLRKAAFVHIAYGNSGYTREMVDRDCYERWIRSSTVSQETRRHFWNFIGIWEESAGFHNILDTDRIAREVLLQAVFRFYTGIRILTVGRLAYQTRHRNSAMKRSAKMAMRRDGILGRSRNALESNCRLGLQEISSCRAKENLFTSLCCAWSLRSCNTVWWKHRAIQEAQT